jgi:hypothetical protein
MYERAMVDGKMLLQSTGMNDAQDRAAVDSQVTFPSGWQNVQTPPQRGLSPGRQGADRIMAQMDTGQLEPSSAKRHAFEATNPHFNPHTKQIFIGLNYGRRAHGSTTNWGHSYFVLKSSLKPRCFYYAGDTFNQKGTGNHAGDLQTPYDNLGAILGKKQGDNSDTSILRREILEACYQRKILRDTSYMGSLIEAHHFGELRFRDHVEYMVISPSGATNKLAWPDIVVNARKFAQKHGFKVFQMD